MCPRDNSALESVGKDPLIGALINDRYVVDSVIGKGSSGIVYKATRLMMGREVAVKVLHSFLGADSGSLDRVLREFAAASKLRHPHIITLWEHGITDDQQPYLVMDYLEGGTLADLIKEREFLQPTRALPIVEQVCDALTEAHSHGIVHRDIKPENVVLEEMGDGDDYVNDYVKVLDFGIADVPEAKSVQVGRPKTVAGSPAYMSPEQCQGLPLDQRSDIYSMAVMVFEMLTGERPFKHEEHRALMLAHVTEPPIKLSEARQELTFPDELEQVFAKALAKKPDARYQEIRDFWLSLKDACKTYKSSPQPVRVANKKVDSVKVDAFEFSPMERLTDGTENAGQLIPWGDDIKSPELPPPMPSTVPYGGHTNEAARALAAESEGDLWALEPNRNNSPMAPEAWLKSATAEPETEESSFESGWGADPSSKSQAPPPPPPGYSPLPAVSPTSQAPSPASGQGMVQMQNKSSQSSAQTAFTGSQSKPNGPVQQSGMNTAAGLSGQHSKPLVQPPSKGGPAVPMAKNPPPNGVPGAVQSSSQPVQQNHQGAQNPTSPLQNIATQSPNKNIAAPGPNAPAQNQSGPVAPAAPTQNAAPRNLPPQNAQAQNPAQQNVPQKPVQNTNAPVAQNQQPNQGAPLPPNGVTAGAGASGARPQQGAPQVSPQQIAPNSPNPVRPNTGAGVSGPQPQRIGVPGNSQPARVSTGAPQAQKIGGPQAQNIQPTPPSAPILQSDDSGIKVSTGKTQQQQRNMEEASALPAAKAPAAPPLPTPSPEDLERER
ncbi:MAG: protein kinase, partial [Leptolyngbya sp.]|nr:protein kinase [Candidatus Melainabacteria bacterium]